MVREVIDQEFNGTGRMGRVSQLVEVMREAKREMDEAEDAFKDAKAKYQKLEREDLPTLMQELGYKSIVLSDGSVIDIIEDVETSITEARRTAAHDWLTEHGYSGIIKSAISMEFDRKELEEARRIAEEIAEIADGRPVSIQEKIHPMTLKAFVKEQLEKGVAIPFDLFNIFPFSRAKIKSAK